MFTSGPGLVDFGGGSKADGGGLRQVRPMDGGGTEKPCPGFQSHEQAKGWKRLEEAEGKTSFAGRGPKAGRCLPSQSFGSREAAIPLEPPGGG